MDAEELLAQDIAAKQWIEEIDSFKSPPPPRRLADLNGLEHKQRNCGDSSTPASSAIHSRDGSCSVDTDACRSVTNGREKDEAAEEAPQDNFIVEKVRQFERSDAHPYASHRRVETSKKIAAQGGGNLASILVGEKSKQRISKEEASELRSAVLQENRVYNPYPSPYAGKENGRWPDSSDSSGVSGSSSLTWRARDSPRSSTATATVNYAAGSIQKQHQPQRRSLAQRSLSNPSAADISAAAAKHGPPTVASLRSSPIAPGSGDQPPISWKTVTTSRGRNAEQKSSDETTGAHQVQTARTVPASTRVEDEEMSKIYRTFDVELKNFGVRQPSKRESGGGERTDRVVDETSNGAQPPAYAKSRRIYPLPPYTGIREQASVTRAREEGQRTRIYAAPIPSASLLPPLPLRQQKHYDVPAVSKYNGGHRNGYGAPPSPPPPPVPPPPVRTPSAPTPPESGVRSSYTSNNGTGIDVEQKHRRTNSFSGSISRNTPNSTQSAVERQQRMWVDFERQVAKDLEKKAVPIGLCYHCGVEVTNPVDATQALGHLYHTHCFTCYSCGRPLNGKKFYEARGKVYCEEDYLYSGFQHCAERCASCGHLIMDMILQAMGESFHPGCFKCQECRRGLENVPFTVDERGQVYCIDDYHRLFAPRCAKCKQPITPTNGREETVRVVAMQRDYHIDCYSCEGCGMRLTDEDEKRCYPLGEHLLCQRCHIYWSRTGGATQPITDV